MECRRFDSPEALTRALAEALAEAAWNTDPGPRALMLAGGRTPLAAYSLLAASPASWKEPPFVFLSDERHVPRAHKDSNYGAIAPLMIGWGIPASRFMPVPTGLPLEAAATAWHAQLDGWIADGMCFPFGLLGMGADGHTASLFTLDDVRRAEACGVWAVPVVKAAPPDRISLTPAFLRRVEKIVLAVTGREKRDMVDTLLRRPETIPAGVVLGDHPGVELWVDDAACP